MFRVKNAELEGPGFGVLVRWILLLVRGYSNNPSCFGRSPTCDLHYQRSYLEPSLARMCVIKSFRVALALRSGFGEVFGK